MVALSYHLAWMPFWPLDLEIVGRLTLARLDTTDGWMDRRMDEAEKKEDSQWPGGKEILKEIVRFHKSSMGGN